MKDKPNFSGRWGIKKLGDVAELNPKTSNDILPDDLEVDFIPMRLVEEKTGGIAEPEKRKFHSVKQGYVSFANNDILFAKVTPCMENGKVAIVNNLNNNIGFGSSEFHVIRVSEQILNSFLFYFLIRDKFRSEAAANMTGAVGLRRVPKQFLENYRLPVPPLSEQKQIVDKIEELFSELDAGRRQLESVKEQLKTYRQAVLKSAFEGKLTNENVLASELPVGWRWVKLKEIVSVLGDGLHGTPSYSQSGEYYFINGNNLRNGKIILKSDTRTVDGSEYQKYKKELNDRTILISINGTLGNMAFFNNEKIILGKSACYFNLLDCADKKFICYALQSLRFINYANRTATGSTIKNVSLKAMREFELLMPPTKEKQIFIVNEIESRFSACDKLEGTIEACLQQTEALKQTILNYAFEGKLVKTQTN